MMYYAHSAAKAVLRGLFSGGLHFFRVLNGFSGGITSPHTIYISLEMLIKSSQVLNLVTLKKNAKKKTKHYRIMPLLLTKDELL